MAPRIVDSLKQDDVRRLARGDAADEEALDDIAEAARLILGNASRARELVTSFKNLSVRQVTDKKAEPIRNRGQRVGRNELCPCGSGKKYKNCHMRSAAV